MKRIRDFITKRNVFIFIISVIVILLLSFSYALFSTFDTTVENIAKTECFRLDLQDQNDINLNKTFPLTEQEGSLLIPYQFTIKNVCNLTADYQVNIETKDDSTLSTSYLKYKLDNNSPDILGNQLLVQEYVNENIVESRNIEAGVILPNEEITYNLRLWIDEASTTAQSANKLYKGKVVIKALENKEPYQTITLNPNGGEVLYNELIKVKQRKLGSIEVPSRIGYTFDGWYLNSELTNRVSEETIVTTDMNNLYAKWAANTYTVTFNTNGGVGEVSDQEFTYDTPQNLRSASLTKTDYTFAGWSLVTNDPVDYKNSAEVNNLTSTNNDIVTLNAVWVKNITNLSYTGSSQTYKILADGTYKIQLWGASGGSTYGGKGAYTAGNIALNKNKNLYIYVGEKSDDSAGTVSYNGGGVGGGGYSGRKGGGATDVRLMNGDWDSFDSLKSRIMVAAGGAGGMTNWANHPFYGGAAGGLNGYGGTSYRSYASSSFTNAVGGTQTSGGAGAVGYSGYNGSGKFGRGGDPYSSWQGSGGGSGWYGGGGGSANNGILGTGAGGSSFIAGHSGCNAINTTTSTSSSIVHTGSSNVVYNQVTYSFSSTKMIDGSGYVWTSSRGGYEVMPNPNGGNFSQGTGNNGSGYARVTLISLN